MGRLKGPDLILHMKITCFVLAFTLSVATGKAQNDWQSLPLTQVSTEAIESTSVSEGLVYARYGNRTLELDLYRPTAPRKKALPGIVCIHGGAWWKGERRNISGIARELAARGFVTVAISYRLSQEAPFPAQIHDCKAAVRWLRANAEEYGIDPTKIGALGTSAGGHLAALLATSGGVDALEGTGGNSEYSSAIQAAAPMGAQSDLLTDRIARRSKDPAAAFYPQFLGGTQEEVPETYRLASPRHHLDSMDPPLYFLTGSLDDPSTQAEAIREDMTKLGISNGLYVIQNAPHAFPTRQPFFDIAINKLEQAFGMFLK